MANQRFAHLSDLRREMVGSYGNRYKYSLTEFGRQAAAMALKLRKMVVIPELAHAVNAQA